MAERNAKRPAAPETARNATKPRTEPPRPPSVTGAVPAAPVGVAAVAAGSQDIVRPLIVPPGPSTAGKNARDNMKFICPYVLQELPKAMNLHFKIGCASMPATPPLAIMSDGGLVKSFKEPWQPKHCVDAIKSTGLYEAGGNLCWVDPEVTQDPATLPNAAEDPSWEWVWEFSEVGFQPVELQGVRDRIRFPVPIETFWEQGPRNAEDYPNGLKPFAAHAYVWAWYVAVFRCLGSTDLDRLMRLYECALTCTICVRTDARPEALAIDFLLYAERVREGTKALCVNFVTFADKVSLIAGPDKLDIIDLQKKQLRFAGGLINATMVKAVTGLRGILTPEARNLISEIDRRFGRDVLSGSYNKVRLLVGACQQKTGDGKEQFVWALQTLLVMLVRKDATVAEFTVTTFSKGKNGNPSWISQSLATRAIVRHIFHVVDSAGLVDQKLAQKIKEHVCVHLRDPVLYNATFPIASDEKQQESLVDVESVADDIEDAGAVFMGKVQKELPRAGVLVAELLRKVYSGGYDDDVTVLSGEVEWASVRNRYTSTTLLYTYIYI